MKANKSSDIQGPLKQHIKVIFGGTFDPFHLGHLRIAQHIIDWLSLDKITLLPANIPPHKAAAKVSAQDRLAMLTELACEYPAFNIDARELARDKPSYTVDTLQELEIDEPDTQLSLLIGMDSLLNFEKWVQWQDIINRVNLLVCTRPGYDSNNIKAALNTKLRNRLVTLDEADFHAAGQIVLAPPIQQDISSTQLRALLSSSESHSTAKSMLPNTVWSYICTNSLYR
ncbi:nicotinate-nucleotide adenylyltransferase [Thalassotalea euphylliae]|uniref:nicotinate-nucleotide adenylyltransferase n=1 Tax=Thalassotalea euphylliae TaxID=1655234 RepID=UPI00362C6C5A